ncbi:MAG TPA: PDZ domain-containing protein [Actinomycetota bacterium]|jgi:PDZ domain-containing protein|nr:PDZ domain-containing protein [Actinomycetota bacterium]
MSDQPERPGGFEAESSHRRGGVPWRGLRRLLAIGLAAVIVVAAFTVPIPMFAEFLPGPARNVEGLVSIDGAPTYSSEGGLYFTTVTVSLNVTFAEWVRSHFDSHSTVIMKRDLTGGLSLKELQRQERQQMRMSKRRAEEVALSQLGFGAPHGDGARVVDVLDGYPAARRLRRGDVIVKVDGAPVETSCDVGREVSRASIEQTLSMIVRRKERTKTVVVRTVRNPLDDSSAFIGVRMQDVNYRYHPGVRVTIETGEVGGPSAGLMFALAIYDKLTPSDLTHGLRIAGTGSIECDGDVGAIGGVEEKVAGAAQQGASVFLAPAENYSDAKSAAPDGIEVVKVDSFKDAVGYLESLD